MESFKTITYKGENIDVGNLGTIVWNNSIRNPYYNHDGYPVCSIKTKDGWRSVAIHILVAIAYVPNPNKLEEVNHKDYDRKNYSINNLEWISHIDNIRYSIINKPDYHGDKNPNYNNNTLHNKYLNDPKLAKEKQSRPGKQNGRSTPIEMYYDNKFVKRFDYISLCCEYIMNNYDINVSNPESIRSSLNKAIRNNRPYKEHFTFVKL